MTCTASFGNQFLLIKTINQRNRNEIRTRRPLTIALNRFQRISQPRHSVAAKEKTTKEPYGTTETSKYIVAYFFMGQGPLCQMDEAVFCMGRRILREETKWGKGPNLDQKAVKLRNFLLLAKVCNNEATNSATNARIVTDVLENF